MNRESLRGGALQVLRIYLAIFTGFSLFALISNLIFGEFAGRFEGLPWLDFPVYALLLLYLSLPWLQKRLGRAYLPLALAAVTLLPMLTSRLAINTAAGPELFRVRLIADQWQVTFMLLVPLILVGWSYSMRVTVAYILGVTAISTALFALPPSPPIAPNPPFFGVALQRTAIFLLVGFVINRLAGEMRRRNHALEQANLQLARTAATREQLVVSRERNRLAREMHDTLAHSLSALSVQLEAVHALWDQQPERARAMLDNSLEITRSGLREARGSIESLRAAPLEDLGLTLALRNLGASIAERSGFTFSADLPEDGVSFPPEVEHVLYRVSEEALRNASRHAGAKQVTLRLAQTGSGAALRIEDDGSGFESSPAALAGHFGLRGMREWADTIGARLDISSRAGGGTAISLEWSGKNDQSLDL